MDELNLPKRVVFIGASSCFGTGDTLGGGFAGRFKNWYEGASEDEIFSVYNLAIPGDTVKGMVKRFDEIERRRPKLSIVQLGCNDCIRKDSRANPPQTTIRSYKYYTKKLLSKLQELSKVIFISSFPLYELKTTPVEWADHYYLLEDVVRYSNISMEIAKNYQIPVLNILEDWLNKDYEMLLSQDGLHANENGHEYVFQKLRDQFLKIYHINIK